MFSLGVVVWENNSGAMIVWCSETAELSYVPDAKTICKGPLPRQADTVFLKSQKRGPYYIGVQMRMKERASGESLVKALSKELDKQEEKQAGDLIAFPRRRRRASN